MKEKRTNPKESSGHNPNTTGARLPQPGGASALSPRLVFHFIKAGLVLTAVVMMSGCASFSTVQTDESYEDGKLTRKITTRAKARTLIESKSALTQFKALQTDKSQAASVGSLSQESAISTNGVNALEAISRGIGEGAVMGARKAVIP